MAVDATDNIIPGSGIQTVSQNYITAGAMPYDSTDRTFSRQLLSGNMRGNQNITGTLTITSPTTNQPIITIDGTTGVINIGNSSTTSSGTSTGTSSAEGAFIVTNTDGSTVGMGAIPDNSGDFGFFAQDGSGNLLYKIVGSTIYVYDVTNDTNVMQVMKLPDGTYGWAVAATGSNVVDGFS